MGSPSSITRFQLRSEKTIAPELPDAALFADALNRIARGTLTTIKDLILPDQAAFVGRMDCWTGRYALAEAYEGFDSGFLLGKLALLHLHTKDDEFLRAAQHILEPMIPLLCDSPPENIWPGMDVYTGLCWMAEITGEAIWRDRAIQATEQLVGKLWSEPAQLVLYGVGLGYTDIDTPLRLQSLGWCGRYAPVMLYRLRRHMHTLLELGFVRRDGSTYQAAKFDLESDAFANFTVTQGWRLDSTWSRGQAWAMHNFGWAFEATGDHDLLKAAETVSNWWIARVPEDGVPFYDFDDPDRERLPIDTCAAAIAANALLRLSKLIPERRDQYLEIASRTMRSLIKQHMTESGLVVHGTWGNAHGRWHRPMRWPREDIMPYSNFYLVEALYRYLHPDADVLSLPNSRFL